VTFVDLDLGSPRGREAGLRRPVVVITAQEILDESANVVQIVPLTTTVRAFGSEVEIQADESNGLESDSAAQCQHIRSVSVDRVESVRGNVGAATISEIREVLALILDIN
jgi:mRNA interferase MazF